MSRLRSKLGSYLTWSAVLWHCCQIVHAFQKCFALFDQIPRLDLVEVLAIKSCPFEQGNHLGSQGIALTCKWRQVMPRFL